MATEKVILEIAAQTADAQKKLNRFGTDVAKTMRGIESSLGGVKAIAAGVVGFFAGRALISGLKDITTAASIQEDAVNELNTSLRLTGKFSEESSKSLQGFARDLQKVTTLGDEVILSNAALIQSLAGLDEHGLKRATAAAADLSAALNIDLRTASEILGRTALGEVGSLAGYGIVIKKTEDNAKTFADALDILESKFSGAAASKVDTYSGAQAQLYSTINELKEELGFLITQNPIVINGIKKLTKFFSGMIEVVNKNRDAVTGLISKGFKALIRTIPSFFTFGQIAVATFDAINDAINTVYKAAIELAKFLVNVYNAATFNPLIKLQELLTGEELPNGARDLAGELDKISDAITTEIDDNSYLQGIANILEDSKTEALLLVDMIDKLPDTKQVNIDINTQANGTSKAVSEIQEELNSLIPANGTSKAVSEIQEELKSIIPANFGVEGPGISRTESLSFPKEGPAEATFWEKSASYFADAFGEKMKELGIGGTIAAGFSAALAGKQGAQKLVAAGAEALGMSVGIPGLGEIADQLMTLGPEGAKEMVRGFAESLPDLIVILIEALTAAAPALIERMVEVLLIEGGLERIVVAIAQAIPRIAYKLVEAFVRNLNTAVVAIGERFGLATFREWKRPEWVEQLREYMSGLTITPEWVRKFQFEQPAWMEKLTEIFEWFIGAIRSAMPSVGGSGGTGILSRYVGGTTGEFLSQAGLAKGGVVYAANGAFVPRGTDTVPAMLTPGERVLTVQQNQSFEQLPMILAQLVSVLSSPMTTETSIEIDGNRLADVILQLNRRNARVA